MQTYQLLNCDDHATYLLKHKRDPALYRPDITHQALLTILDSPLNKAGKLKVNRPGDVRLHACLVATAPVVLPVRHSHVSLGLFPGVQQCWIPHRRLTAFPHGYHPSLRAKHHLHFHHTVIS
jgi:hypothetical protein